MIVVDLGILAAAGYGTYAGTKRGVVLVALELVSFFVATVVAVTAYPAASEVLQGWAGIATSLAHVAAFAVIWMATELICALLARLFLVPRLIKRFPVNWTSQVAGGAVNAVKAIILLTVGLILFAGLPLSALAKRPVTDSLLANTLLASSGLWQHWIQGGLGRDLDDSLTFFTVSAEPESNQHIDLGFTATEVKIDAEGEKTMLKLTNRERVGRGLKPLDINSKARDVARAYSKRMLAEGYFSHIDADKHTPFDRMTAGGVAYNTAGENLALAPTLQLAEQGLMNSPGHRANILSPNYHQVGISVVDAGPYGLMITEDFTD
jgi:uncharacterized protein YkwD/uncharacterized membrane protein required for colicin V production